MPHSVFAPYTSITTNILFFDRTHPTTETWFYRLDMPEGYKNFSKTKPMKLEHFAPAVEWWDNREEITIDGFDKAKKYTVDCPQTKIDGLGLVALNQPHLICPQVFFVIPSYCELYCRRAKRYEDIVFSERFVPLKCLSNSSIIVKDLLSL